MKIDIAALSRKVDLEQKALRDYNEAMRKFAKGKHMKYAEVIDDVLMFLENNKRKAVEALFPGEGVDREGYRKTWMDRSTVRFWQHLDLGNREELVKIATKYYAQFRKVA